MDAHLVIYGQFTWVVFNMAGKRLSSKKIFLETPILVLRMETLEDYSLVYWSGDESSPEMTLETHKAGKMGRRLRFHSGFALSKDQSKVWVCDGDDLCHKVAMYAFVEHKWVRRRSYGDNKCPLLMLELSQVTKVYQGVFSYPSPSFNRFFYQDEVFVIGTFMTGFLLWRLDGAEDTAAEMTTLKLPSGIRNISTKMNKSNSCVLSAGHVYAVAGIRKELYIWTMKDGMLV